MQKLCLAAAGDEAFLAQCDSREEVELCNGDVARFALVLHIYLANNCGLKISQDQILTFVAVDKENSCKCYMEERALLKARVNPETLG